jgi:hypothetical protein
LADSGADVSKINDPKKAGQLARAIASDISIYNTDKIEEALKNDNVFDVIGDELEEGRQLFQKKVEGDLYNNTNIFEKAVIDIIVATRKHVNTPIW